ncbi:aspartate aminotransferase family protein [Usitatibacter palustris]|uniref:Acetylornithine aminotransferase n=1 Tax=Usitatibacter palustris TaxID=2732487 RepID=A0A6M4HEI6_9PROT|nr:aspartate aminotransferase family protein [Usitatibacter palustris]QJR16407.1 Acetylornithine aminotransferase [Usitatibacter palustris]
MSASHLMATYAPNPVAFARGEGAYLFDTQGKRYLDALAGIAVNGLGYAHPEYTRRINEQAGRLIHISNHFTVPEQEALAAKVCALAKMDNAFFANSGAEANECAIKLARLYGHQRGVENSQIIVMEKAWHGRTLATLSATGSRKAQAGFEPLMGGFVRVPYNDLGAIERVAEHNPSVVAILMEVLQGEGGINVANADYLRKLREICDRKQWLLMIDEVQSGIGRTGKWFAHQWTDVVPDVMPLAKGLGSGIPIGACLARGVAASVFKPGNHGTTFGGGPLVSVAGLATLEILEKDGMLANAARQGEIVMEGLKSGLAGVAGVKDIRGMGLMIGVELDRPCGAIVKRALERGLVTNVTADSVIRLVPPLIYGDAQSRELLGLLVPLVKEFLAEAAAAAA